MSAIGRAWLPPGPGYARTQQASGLTIGQTHLSEADIQKLLRMEQFIHYLVHTDPRIGELWDVFAVIERLEK